MIKKAVTYFIIITLVLYGLRYIQYKGLLKQTNGYYDKYTTAFIKKNNFDVLFLGSSRAEMHYNTRLFDSITNSNSFNLSLAGATPNVAFAALKAYLQNSKAPKYLVYEIDYHFLKFDNNEIKNFNNYFPYLSNKTLLNEFSKIDGRMNCFYLNPYYSWPYTGIKNISTSLHGWLNIPNQKDSLYYKGYFKESLRPSLKFSHIDAYYTYFNANSRNYLDSIITTCKQNKINLTLISSPIFAGGMVDLKNKKQIILQLKNIAKINKIQYFDLSSLPFCNQRNLFIDHYHMNYLGANKFSLYFSEFFNNKIAQRSLK
ncbi:MAG: hypothetical protein Q7W45_03355 [Bacteroidota bacterium]|nr:hypothetical protein [Bacteroidota bacterium]MDP3145708.1 hypothetical protein [Bacteroidota bacterium]MDP3558401.1 hypothetical protein [Bacteroidota bacterium]